MGEWDHNDAAKFAGPRIAARAMEELIGICKGIIADGKVNPEETKYLERWLRANPEAAGTWPADVLFRRLKQVLSDGYADPEEREDLRELIYQWVGRPEIKHTATRLPVDDPAPDIIFPDNLFCFTGTFHFAKRSGCEKAVLERGGLVHRNPAQKTDYLVIGLTGTKAWLHSTHGLKIEQAVRLREDHGKLKIIAEEHWVKYLD